MILHHEKNFLTCIMYLKFLELIRMCADKKKSRKISEMIDEGEVRPIKSRLEDFEKQIREIKKDLGMEEQEGEEEKGNGPED